jgi:ketosteroid isomerase-like protein
MVFESCLDQETLFFAKLIRSTVHNNKQYQVDNFLNIRRRTMSITIEDTINLFDLLKTGDTDEFFSQVADNVLWTVMGTHPLAGIYKTKNDFILNTFKRLNKLLKEGVILKVNSIIVQDDTAVVEMESFSTALNDKPFNNTYCWICSFEEDIIVEVRAYVDSALVQRLINENE